MTSPYHPAQAARHAGPAELAVALQSSRQDTLATFADFERALHDLAVPQRETLNPPLWELGHIGWFQEFWIARNPQRSAGVNADPALPRPSGVRPQADALYHSSEVPHATRWALPLPSAETTRADLAAQLARTLELLRQVDGGDVALYFFRLALLHEDMHHEAALYMAQSLGLPIADVRWLPAPLAASRTELAFTAGPWTLGHSGRGFAFDNELQAHVQQLPATHIDSRVLRWADYLPFVEADGYSEPRWWSDAGCTWLAAERPLAPRYTRREGRAWRPCAPRPMVRTRPDRARLPFDGLRGRSRVPLGRAPAAHRSRMGTRRGRSAGCFRWGQVWEWDGQPLPALPGFSGHPYRDYSAPWFGSRRVLRGASFMTQPRMRHARYRNFFAPHRNDVPAGLRTCRL